MFTAALFTIAETGKQPKRPSADNWIKKLRFIYAMEYYATMKNELLPFAITQMDLEGIMLSEISRTKEDKYRMISRNKNL